MATGRPISRVTPSAPQATAPEPSQYSSQEDIEDFELVELSEFKTSEPLMSEENKPSDDPWVHIPSEEMSLSPSASPQHKMKKEVPEFSKKEEIENCLLPRLESIPMSESVNPIAATDTSSIEVKEFTPPGDEDEIKTPPAVTETIMGLKNIPTPSDIPSPSQSIASIASSTGISLPSEVMLPDSPPTPSLGNNQLFQRGNDRAHIIEITPASIDDPEDKHIKKLSKPEKNCWKPITDCFSSLYHSIKKISKRKPEQTEQVEISKIFTL